MTVKARPEMAARGTLTGSDVSEKKKGEEHVTKEGFWVPKSPVNPRPPPEPPEPVAAAIVTQEVLGAMLATELDPSSCCVKEARPPPQPPEPQDQGVAVIVAAARRVVTGEPSSRAGRSEMRKQEKAATYPFGGSFLNVPEMEVKEREFADLYFDLMGQAQSVKEKEFFKWLVAQIHKDAEQMKAEKKNVDEIKRLIHLLGTMGHVQICEVQAQIGPSLAKLSPMYLDIVIVLHEVSLFNKVGTDMGPRLMLENGVSNHGSERVAHNPSRWASGKGNKSTLWEHMLDLSTVWRNDLQRDSLGRKNCGDEDFYSEMTKAAKHLHWEELLVIDEVGNVPESAKLVECWGIAGGDNKYYQLRAQVAETSRFQETAPQSYGLTDGCAIQGLSGSNGDQKIPICDSWDPTGLSFSASMQSLIYFKIWDPGG